MLPVNDGYIRWLDWYLHRRLTNLLAASRPCPPVFMALPLFYAWVWSPGWPCALRRGPRPNTIATRFSTTARTRALTTILRERPSPPAPSNYPARSSRSTPPRFSLHPTP